MKKMRIVLIGLIVMTVMACGEEKKNADGTVMTEEQILANENCEAFMKDYKVFMDETLEVMEEIAEGEKDFNDPELEALTKKGEALDARAQELGLKSMTGLDCITDYEAMTQEWMKKYQELSDKLYQRMMQEMPDLNQQENESGEN